MSDTMLAYLGLLALVLLNTLVLSPFGWLLFGCIVLTVMLRVRVVPYWVIAVGLGFAFVTLTL